MSLNSLAIFRNVGYFKRDFFWRIGESGSSAPHVVWVLSWTQIFEIFWILLKTSPIERRILVTARNKQSMSLKTESLFACLLWHTSLFTERNHPTFSSQVMAVYNQWPLLELNPSQNSLNSSIWRWSSSPMSSALPAVPATSSIPRHSPGWCLK